METPAIKAIQALHTHTMPDIRHLIDDLARLHQQAYAGDPLTMPQLEQWMREWAEIKATLLSKLSKVKYFRSIGESMLKYSTDAHQKPYLEIVTVFEQPGYTAEIEIQVHPMKGWYSVFRNCEPCTEADYRAQVAAAIEKGAVVI